MQLDRRSNDVRTNFPFSHLNSIRVLLCEPQNDSIGLYIWCNLSIGCVTIFLKLIGDEYKVDHFLDRVWTCTCETIQFFFLLGLFVQFRLLISVRKFSVIFQYRLISNDSKKNMRLAKNLIWVNRIYSESLGIENSDLPGIDNCVRIPSWNLLIFFRKIERLFIAIKMILDLLLEINENV